MTHRVLDRQQSREVDVVAQQRYGMAGLVLMENAGRESARLLLEQGINGDVLVVCGPGNNGGDGFVIARHLHNAGIAVRVLLIGSPDQLARAPDAAANFKILQQMPVAIEIDDSLDARRIQEFLRTCAEPENAWVVDTLLGTGSRGALREPLLTVVRAINQFPGRRMSIDLPTGMDCDGQEDQECVQAHLTATMVALKPCFLRPNTRRLAGKVRVIDIGVPREVIDLVESPEGSKHDSTLQEH